MQRIFAISLLSVLGWFALSPAITSAAEATTSTAATLNLFYMGNRASRLEPCGCHSRQQGGVQFEAVLYEQYAATPGIRLDLGDWVAYAINDRPVDLMLTRYLMRALTALRMDAVNMGLHDIELTSEYLKKFEEKYPGQMPPLVSANVYAKDQLDKPAFAPYRIVEKTIGGKTIKVGITGVAWIYSPANMGMKGGIRPTQRETVSFVAREPVKSLTPVVAELRPKVDLLILISSGEADSAAEIAKAFPAADIVIASNGDGAPQSAIAQSGTVRILFGRNSQGKEVGYLPLERQGTRWEFPRLPVYLGVTKDLTPKPEMMALIGEFKKETHKLKPKLPEPNVKEVYAGAKYCKMCHAEEYASWEKTRHAKAITTLIGKEQQFNPNCLKCHVTGFQQSNGFYAIGHAPSRKMTDVQCEMCHGPGRAHAEAEQLKKSGGQNFMAAEDYQRKMDEGAKFHPKREVPEKVCLGCHTPENDAHFVYQEKLPKVKHQ